MLKTGCIKSEPTAEDGLRISVMSRHTLNDGVTPNPEITNELFDEWWPELGPPAKLVGEYYKRRLTWQDFEERYRAHLLEQNMLPVLGRLATLALSQDVTILCIEATPEECHRRLIAEDCQLMTPGLEVQIR